METQGANVRKGVLVVSSVMLTIQLATLAATGVFYFFATSKDYRDFLSDRVLSVFYQTPQEILALRRGHALEVRMSRGDSSKYFKCGYYKRHYSFFRRMARNKIAHIGDLDLLKI